MNWCQSSLAWQSDFPNSKLEMVKSIDTPRIVNAILLNIKINQPELVNLCKYKLAKYW